MSRPYAARLARGQVWVGQAPPLAVADVHEAAADDVLPDVGDGRHRVTSRCAVPAEIPVRLSIIGYEMPWSISAANVGPTARHRSRPSLASRARFNRSRAFPVGGVSVIHAPASPLVPLWNALAFHSGMPSVTVQDARREGEQ